MDLLNEYNNPMRVFLHLLMALVSFAASGQAIDSLPAPPYGQALASALRMYDSVNVWSQHLYNGPSYFVYDAKSEDHPFFESRDWVRGSVNYNGQLYDGVMLKYDIVKDQLIMRHYEGEGHISLQKDRVSFFALGKHQFYRYESGKGVGKDMKATFYQMLYAGKTRVLARRAKERLTKIENMRVIAQFFEKDHYYLLKNGADVGVKRKKALLELFPDRKKELKKYWRANGIQFSDSREEAIVKTVIHYDELTQR